MFRPLPTVALATLAKIACITLALAIAGCSEPRLTTPANLPKELAVDLGGGVKLELVLIPAGEFMMGSPNADNGAPISEKPPHRVRITKPFYLGKYPVTQEQWQAVMGNNPSSVKEDPKCPVESVTWDNCQNFLTELNRKTGGQKGKFVLPTEAQWEYACRAGSTTHYCFGNSEADLGDYAWYEANAAGVLHPVGEKKPNAWGLYDMHGSVWEWCQDWYDPRYYAESPTDDPPGPATSSEVVMRGAGYNVPMGARSAMRLSSKPGQTNTAQGLRVALVVPDK